MPIYALGGYKYSFAQALSEFVRDTPPEEIRNKLTQTCAKD